MVKKKIGNIINIDLIIYNCTKSKTIFRLKQLYKTTYSVTKHGIVGLTKYYASLYAKTK